MSNVITNRVRVSRRHFLKGVTLAGSAVQVGLPPLVSMFNSNPTAYAADAGAGRLVDKAIENRFVFWFNGNGIPERYWIPTETGTEYRISSALSPLAPFRNDIHVLSGLDNQAANASGPGNAHHKAAAVSRVALPLLGMAQADRRLTRRSPQK